jgi:hypothetical protein
MAGAVALVGIGLLSIGLSNFANRAQAVPSVAIPVTLGPAEPTIVAFGSVGLNGNANSDMDLVFYRLWSDTRIEIRVLGIQSAWGILACGWPVLLNTTYCNSDLPEDTGWIELPSPPGGDGFACRGDINGDRSVNAADLGLLIAQWGAEGTCDPQPTYPCFDLGNLSIAAAK